METTKEKARKALVAQTSEVLVNKLNKGSLLGASKDIAIEILKARKEKGSFKGEIPDGTDVESTKKPAATKEKVAKPAKEKVAKAVKEPKVKTPKEPKVRKERKSSFKGTFEKGDKVKFAPFKQENEITGIVMRCYMYENGKGVKLEGVVVKAVKDGTIYRKNVENVKKVA